MTSRVNKCSSFVVHQFSFRYNVLIDIAITPQSVLCGPMCSVSLIDNLYSTVLKCFLLALL
jgi:hypothetical protein